MRVCVSVCVSVCVCVQVIPWGRLLAVKESGDIVEHQLGGLGFPSLSLLKSAMNGVELGGGALEHLGV